MTTLEPTRRISLERRRERTGISDYSIMQGVEAMALLVATRAGH